MADNPKSVGRVLVDLDGTITVGPGHGPLDFAPVRTGAGEFLRELHGLFDEVVVFSARPPDAVKAFLRRSGLMHFVNDCTNLKLPAKVYIDDRAIEFKGDYPATLEAARGFEPHWEKQGAASGAPTSNAQASNVGSPKHEYASTQFDLNPSDAAKVIAVGRRIPDEDLDEKGREDKAHVTVLYGITEDDPAKVAQAVKGFGVVAARLGAVSFFETPDRDVVKVEVHSPDLHRLRKKLEQAIPFETDYPDYQPHITIAYVKRGRGRESAGNLDLRGVDLRFDTLQFSPSQGASTPLPLK